ncbi:TonB-dependent receptor [Halocola ammonii]
MKKHLWLSLFFSLIFAIASNAQEVSGIVKSAVSGESLPGVTVTSKSGKGTSTDADGFYRLALDSGKHTVSFSFIGFEKVTEKIALEVGETLSLNISLNPSAELLEIAVVSAGKFEQDLEDLTVSMEVIKPDLIQNKNTTELQTVMQQTPGVSIVDGEPQIRSGSGYSFGAGSRVQILVDDLPILSGDAGRPSWGFLPVENVEQIEVVKGASSVLYGSAALSGVINIRTSFPRDTAVTRVQVFQGIYSNPQTEEAVYWERNPLKSGVNFLHSQKFGNLDLSVSGNALVDEGYLGPIEGDGSAYSPANVNRYNGESRIRGNLKMRYRSKKVEGLSYGLNTSWLKGESLATLIWENNKEGLYRAYDGSATRTRQVVSSVDPFAELVTENGSKHSLNGRWFQLDNNNDNNQDNFSDVYYGEYQYQQDFGRFGVSDLKTTFGLVGIHTDSRAELYSGGETNGENQSQNFASYLQVDKTFFDRLKISAGVRYEHFKINDSEEGKPVFRAGANYKLSKATFLRASYGQGFRFPTIAERFLQTQAGAIRIYPNPDLKAETSESVEFGIKQGFKIGRFKGYLDAAVFYQHYQNFIEFTFGPWGQNPTPENIYGLGFASLNTGNSEVKGVDISLLGEGKIGNVNLQMLAGYTYSLPQTLSPELPYNEEDEVSVFYYALTGSATVNYESSSSNTDDNILKYRMQHLVRADIQLSWKKWTFGTSFRYNSFMQNIDQVFLALDDPNTFEQAQVNTGITEWRENHDNGDYVFDGRLLFNIKPNQIVGLIVSNVLNREYTIRPLVIEAPRETTIQYTLKF